MFLFNPKGYFLAFSSLGKARLGVRASRRSEGLGRPLLPFPPSLLRSCRRLYPSGLVPPRGPWALVEHLSVSLCDWPRVGFASEHHSQGSFIQSKLPTEPSPLPSPPPNHPDGPTDTHSRKDQGGRSCGDERVGGQQAGSAHPAGRSQLGSCPLPLSGVQPNPLLFVQVPWRPSPSLSLPLAGPCGRQ